MCIPVIFSDYSCLPKQNKGSTTYICEKITRKILNCSSVAGCVMVKRQLYMFWLFQGIKIINLIVDKRNSDLNVQKSNTMLTFTLHTSLYYIHYKWTSMAVVIYVNEELAERYKLENLRIYFETINEQETIYNSLFFMHFFFFESTKKCLKWYLKHLIWAPNLPFVKKKYWKHSFGIASNHFSSLPISVKNIWNFKHFTRFFFHIAP